MKAEGTTVIDFKSHPTYSYILQRDYVAQAGVLHNNHASINKGNTYCLTELVSKLNTSLTIISTVLKPVLRKGNRIQKKKKKTHIELGMNFLDVMNDTSHIQ